MMRLFQHTLLFSNDETKQDLSGNWYAPRIIAVENKLNIIIISLFCCNSHSKCNTISNLCELYRATTRTRLQAESAHLLCRKMTRRTSYGCKNSLRKQTLFLTKQQQALHLSKTLLLLREVFLQRSDMNSRAFENLA